MSTHDHDALLETYLDGELSWLRRHLLERRLRRSPTLRARLDELTAWGDLVARGEGLSAEAAPIDLFSDIASQLSAIDREVEAGSVSSTGFTRAGSSWFGWSSVAAAGALAVLLMSTLSGVLDRDLAAVVEAATGTSTGSVERGALRYLNTDGRPVMVSQDGEDTTIIWLMDRPAGSA